MVRRCLLLAGGVGTRFLQFRDENRHTLINRPFPCNCVETGSETVLGESTVRFRVIVEKQVQLATVFGVFPSILEFAVPQGPKCVYQNRNPQLLLRLTICIV